jgi:hypothetical protein
LCDAYERGLVSKLLHYNRIFDAIESEALTPIL